MPGHASPHTWLKDVVYVQDHPPPSSKLPPSDMMGLEEVEGLMRQVLAVAADTHISDINTDYAHLPLLCALSYETFLQACPDAKQAHEEMRRFLQAVRYFSSEGCSHLPCYRRMKWYSRFLGVPVVPYHHAKHHHLHTSLKFRPYPADAPCQALGAYLYLKAVFSSEDESVAGDDIVFLLSAHEALKPFSPTVSAADVYSPETVILDVLDRWEQGFFARLTSLYLLFASEQIAFKALSRERAEMGARLPTMYSFFRGVITQAGHVQESAKYKMLVRAVLQLADPEKDDISPNHFLRLALQAGLSGVVDNEATAEAESAAARAVSQQKERRERAERQALEQRQQQQRQLEREAAELMRVQREKQADADREDPFAGAGGSSSRRSAVLTREEAMVQAKTSSVLQAFRADAEAAKLREAQQQSASFSSRKQVQHSKHKRVAQPSSASSSSKTSTQRALFTASGQNSPVATNETNQHASQTHQTHAPRTSHLVLSKQLEELQEYHSNMARSALKVSESEWEHERHALTQQLRSAQFDLRSCQKLLQTESEKTDQMAKQHEEERRKWHTTETELRAEFASQLSELSKEKFSLALRLKDALANQPQGLGNMEGSDYRAIVANGGRLDSVPKADLDKINSELHSMEALIQGLNNENAKLLADLKKEQGRGDRREESMFEENRDLKNRVEQLSLQVKGMQVSGEARAGASVSSSSSSS
eukprot:CAMPEP_0175120036 /NCGR_PEP_ID=MMETSP0087-20121206/398_1 /TAXON_ID=136419 /ORGANISM="Unknown Unknown, Strain D1" /LENGTH=709 /DNA_ID=CAMNT_0016401439 /DNA_START=98 /DNA_END=2224 /DNA_ORIENTATION=-